VTAQSSTLLRGQASIGGTCGSFDFGAAMTEAFESIPALMEGYIQGIIANMPMLVLCYASPSLCDLAKHFQSLVSAIISARYAQCTQIQTAMAYSGLRLRGGEISACLEEQATAGASISEALRTCHSGVSSLRSPLGGRATQVDVLRETLEAAGASAEMRTLARSLLGEITLSAHGGQLGTSQDRPGAAMLARYEGHRGEVDVAVRRAIAEVRTTGTVTETTLQAIAVPGQPIPRAALEALAALQQDPVRYESLLQKLTTGLAITRLTWECAEIQDQLAGAIDANQHLSEEQRRLLERRLEALDRDLTHVMAKKEVVERHLQPAVDALLSEYAAVQQTATQAGLRAPGRGTPPLPYQTQFPAGYGR
jgi:hypothetical protein